MSSLSWLDFSESDRQKALDVIDLFRDKGTVDELGVGTIRDAIADDSAHRNYGDYVVRQVHFFRR